MTVVVEIKAFKTLGTSHFLQGWRTSELSANCQRIFKNTKRKKATFKACFKSMKYSQVPVSKLLSLKLFFGA